MPLTVIKRKFVFDQVAKGNIMMRVMDFLIQNQHSDFTIREIVKGADVGRTTLWEGGVLEHMKNEGLIINTKIAGNAKLYRINSQDEKVKALIVLHEALTNGKDV